jgi:hypothetical protein
MVPFQASLISVKLNIKYSFTKPHKTDYRGFSVHVKEKKEGVTASAKEHPGH